MREGGGPLTHDLGLSAVRSHGCAASRLYFYMFDDNEKMLEVGNLPLT